MKRNNSNYKPIYKEWYFWVLIILLIIVLSVLYSQLNTDETSSNVLQRNQQNILEVKNENNASSTTNITQNNATEKENNVSKVPIEYQNALTKAKIYSDTMYMSKQKIYDQLVSEYGEQFTKEAAQYAIDNLKTNYKRNALEKAKTYQKTMSMSKNAIYDQLISKYGEEFTKEEAQYAIDNLDN